MNFSAFINFDGNCKEAVTFYAHVFALEVPKMMTFGFAPKTKGFEVSEEDRSRVLYTSLTIGDKNIMFSDCASDIEHIRGNNVALVIGCKEMTQVKDLFDKLKDQGEVLTELGSTFFSKAYGMVKDKFGVIWQIILEGETF